MGPRAGEHGDPMGPRAGEHEGHTGRRAGGFCARLEPWGAVRADAMLAVAGRLVAGLLCVERVRVKGEGEG